MSPLSFASRASFLVVALLLSQCSAPPSERREPRDSGTGGAPAEPNYSGCACPVTEKDGTPTMELDCYCSKYTCPKTLEEALEPSMNPYISVFTNRCAPEADAPPLATWADGWNAVSFYFDSEGLIGGYLSLEVSDPLCEGWGFTFGTRPVYKGYLCDSCLLSYREHRAAEGECLDEDILRQPPMGGMGGIVQ